MKRLPANMLHPFLLLYFLLIWTMGFGQEENKINKFIKKNQLTDFEIFFSNDSVPQTLNLLFWGILKADKKSQITIPANLFSNYFYSNEFTILKSGRCILLNQNAIQSDTAFVTIHLKGSNDLSQMLKIPLNYKGHLLLDYSGRNGIRGENGAKGKNGKISGPSSISPEPGENGRHGLDGENGPILQCRIRQQNKSNYSEPQLFVIDIQILGTKYYETFKFDTTCSDVTLIVNGGDGGDGGIGGDGGHGSDGDQSRYASYGQFGALGGKGGNGGAGGNGGQVVLSIDENFKSLLQKVQIINTGGNGGKGGRQGTMGSRGVNYFNGHESMDVRTIRTMHKDMPDFNGLDGISGEDGPEPEII